MRVVNRVEHELYQTQLVEWVHRELQACDDIADLMQLNKTADRVNSGELRNIKAALHSYCDSCRGVLQGPSVTASPSAVLK